MPRESVRKRIRHRQMSCCAGLDWRIGPVSSPTSFPEDSAAGLWRARALIHHPALILADEPTNDLDEHWSLEIIRILKEQAGSGSAVVMVTHNSRWAEEASKRCRLEDGILIDISQTAAI